MLLEIILLGAFILPGFMILKLGKIKVDNTAQILFLSYVLSVAITFGILYVGGILGKFNMASVILGLLVITSIIYSAVLLAKDLQKYRRVATTFFRSTFPTSKLAIIVSAVGIVLIYTIFLCSREILDSDAVQYYLPIAREIVRTNSFTCGTGYDYNIFLRPIGGSVLYAWVYVSSGSLSSEVFRVIPLIPMLVLMIANYAIATSATKSRIVGLISTAIFLVLPFHDRFLLYNAFYPDVFYYPLMFIVTYFFLEYFKTRRDILLFWVGIALGVASLIKAQTVYFLIAIPLIMIAFKLSSKKISLVACSLTPFYILVPNILVESVQQKRLQLSGIPFTDTELELLIFLVIISGICYLVVAQQAALNRGVKSLISVGLVKKLVLLLVPFAIFSSLWYANNFLRFGTLLYTSSVDLPNYNWALSIEKSLEPITIPATTWHYLTYFAFMFVDPSVMGYVWLLPLLIGLIYTLRARLQSLNFLVFFGVTLAIIIFSNIAYSIPYVGTVAYNPRNLLPLAPLLTTLSAIGIVSMSSLFSKRINGTYVLTSLLLVAYFGLIGYAHSVLLRFTDRFFTASFVGQLLKGTLSVFGLTLTQTSFQLSTENRVIFVAENMWKILAFSFVVGLLPLFFIIFHRYGSLRRVHIATTRINVRLKATKLKFSLRIASITSLAFVKVVLMSSLLLAIILIPRTEIFIIQGDLQNIRENQMRIAYSSFYEILVDEGREFNGDILTFKAPMGLPYYIPEVKIVDLKYPANLAFFKDSLLSNSTYTTILKLKQQSVSYLLIDPSITKELDARLNSIISKILQNPEFAILSKTLGSWKLYTLGPYEVEKTSISLSEWAVDSRYTNASYTFNSSESGIFLELYPTDSESRVTIANHNIPKLNLSSYNYVVTNLEGSSNARIDIRFYLNDGSSFDVAYWKDPYTYITTPFDLRPYIEKTLRGDAYIGLKSSNETSSVLDILEITFIKVIEN